MNAGIKDRDNRVISLRQIDDSNWREVADVAPRDDQRTFVAALGARYLLLSMRGGLWNSLAVVADATVVGHVMWALDTDDGSHWLGGMMIDASEQGKGAGRAATLALMRHLAAQPGCRELRLSCHPDNTSASRLYQGLGFRATGEYEDDEIVMAVAARDVPA
jgi:diamine N-acetyltransferase